jgi:hypothetical protein
MRVTPRLLRFVMNCWPPFVGAGIRVRHIAPDWRHAHVTMKLAWYNRNYVRTQFGGSLYAMTDPFYMIMLLHALGSDYIVWDKSAHIDYIAPARSAVDARFELSDETLADIRARTADGEKCLPEFSIDVTDADGQTVARIKRVLYVRLKARVRPALLEKDHA